MEIVIYIVAQIVHVRRLISSGLFMVRITYFAMVMVPAGLYIFQSQMIILISIIFVKQGHPATLQSILASILCPSNANCHIECIGSYSCANANIYWSLNDLVISNLTCFGKWIIWIII